MFATINQEQIRCPGVYNYNIYSIYDTFRPYKEPV